MAKTVFQVQEMIGNLPHVYNEFDRKQDAVRHIRDLQDASNFSIETVHIKD